MKKISIVIPCYNEQASLRQLYTCIKETIDLCKEYDWEILYINDGSKDATIEIIRELREKDERVCYVDLSRNFGKEAAMLAGFDYATGDAVVIMDADLQHPPSVVIDMIHKWEDGYDDVYGERLSRGKESWLRKSMTNMFYNFLQKSSRFDILPNVGDFRLLDRKCVDVLRTMRECERYTKGMFAWIGFKKASVQFETHDRIAGQSSWNFTSLLHLAANGLTSFSTAPLKLSMFLGLASAILSFMYLIYVLITTLIWGDPVRGYPTLLSSMLFLGGLILLCLGIIGEYLGRIFNETKFRPPYVAREYNGDTNIN